MTSLDEQYRERYQKVLVRAAVALEEHLRDMLSDQPRVDRICARAKSIDRFVAKAVKREGGKLKYLDPLAEIQDQLGARIVTYFLSDVARITEVIEKYYRPIETRELIPDSEAEFGYFGKHYILLLPKGVAPDGVDKAMVPQFFELQIKTLFQHAWSEAEHDLGYKPRGGSLDSDSKRRLAFTSAQAWGADHIFDELFQKLNG